MFLWLATAALASDAGSLRSEGAFDSANDRVGEDTVEVRTRMRLHDGEFEFGDRRSRRSEEHQFLSGDDTEGQGRDARPEWLAREAGHSTSGRDT